MMQTKELHDCCLGFCSLKNLFIKTYNKCMENTQVEELFQKKVAWQTGLETVCELFCMEDSKSKLTKYTKLAIF